MGIECLKERLLLVNIRNEVMYYVEDVVEGVFTFETEDVLAVDMERVLKSRIILGEREILTETERGRSY